MPEEPVWPSWAESWQPERATPLKYGGLLACFVNPLSRESSTSPFSLLPLSSSPLHAQPISFPPGEQEGSCFHRFQEVTWEAEKGTRCPFTLWALITLMKGVSCADLDSASHLYTIKTSGSTIGNHMYEKHGAAVWTHCNLGYQETQLSQSCCQGNRTEVGVGAIRQSYYPQALQPAGGNWVEGSGGLDWEACRTMRHSCHY